MNRFRPILLLAGAASVALAQGPEITNIENAATFQTIQTLPLAPGMLFSIFGSGLSNQLAQPSSLVLPATLGGVTVQFESGSTTLTAPLSYVQPDNASTNVPSQINAQVPWEIAAGVGTGQAWNVTVNNNGAISAPTPVTVGSFAPGIFALNGQAIVINLDGTLAWPVGSLPPLITHPANPGDVVIVYATGLGQVNPSIDDGQNSLDQLRNTTTVPSVLIGGQAAQVPFSGLTPQYPGVNQLNVVVPNIATTPAATIQIQVGGITTPANVTFAVGQ